MKQHKLILNGILIISILLILWIDFIDNVRIPMLISIDYHKVNSLLENISLAYVTSFIFYYIVVKLKENNDRKNIYPFIADYTYVLMNNCMIFSSIMRDYAYIKKESFEPRIDNRNINIYPNPEEIKEICLKINPNELKNQDIGLAGRRAIPHFFGIMINSSVEIDYFLKIIMEKSAYMDTDLLRLLTDIRTSGYHKDMISYGKTAIFSAKHAEANLVVYEKPLEHYFDLFRKLEIYSEKNLKQYVERKVLKEKRKT